MHAQLFRGFIADFDNDSLDQYLFGPRIELPDELAQRTLHFGICGDDQSVGAFVARDDNRSTSADAVHARR